MLHSNTRLIGDRIALMQQDSDSPLDNFAIEPATTTLTSSVCWVNLPLGIAGDHAALT